MNELPWFEKPEVLKSTLGDRLKKTLRFSNISVGDMALFLQFHRNTLSGWLSDRAKPSQLVLRVLAAKTGVPLQWLRDGNWPDPPTGYSASPAS